MQSRAGNEAIVLLSAGCDYYQEFEAARRIEKYIKQRNIVQLPDAIKKIIQGKQNEEKEREKNATTLLKEAILNGSFYIAGERVQLRGASVKEMLDQAMKRLVEDGSWIMRMPRESWKSCWRFCPRISCPCRFARVQSRPSVPCR